jgi:hypothetical protein
LLARHIWLGDPLEELHGTQLYRTLANLSADSAERIDAFVSKIAPLLGTTIRHFPYYTRHDANHGFHVIRRIEQVVESDCFRAGAPGAFRATELLLLIDAAYSHDLGMTVFPGEEDRLAESLSIRLDSGWETNPALQNICERITRSGVVIISRKTLMSSGCPEI